MARIRQFCIFLVAAGGLLPGATAQPPPGERTPEGDLAQTRNEALRQENRYLQQRIRELEDEIDHGANGDAQLQERLDQAVEQNLSLQSALDRRQAEVAPLESTRTKLQEAQSTIRELESRLEQARLLHQQQTKSLNNLHPVIDELNRTSAALANCNRRIRQLELAVTGAEHQADTIDQLRAATHTLESRIRLLEEERDASLAKVRDAARELTRMREETNAAATARDKAQAAVEAEAQRAREQDAALAATHDASERKTAEFSLERDQWIEALEAAHAERDALTRQIAELAEYRDDLEAASQARITAERRAAAAEANALRAATRADEETARADRLAARLVELEPEQIDRPVPAR